jgi:hypothetical protein
LAKLGETVVEELYLKKQLNLAKFGKKCQRSQFFVTFVASRILQETKQTKLQ